MDEPDDRPLTGRVALITGGSRGIGKALAERIAAAGATVVIGARSVDRARHFPGTASDTVALIESRGGKALALALDLENPASRTAFIDNAIARTGGIDMLVNNAGTAIYKKTDAMTPAEAASQIAAYFLGPWDLCRMIVPHMRARGGGSILNLGSPTASSRYDQFGKRWGDDTLYAALKAAMHRFSLGLGAEVIEHGIAVNVLAPVGGIRTPGLEALNVLPAHDVGIEEPIEHIAEAAVDILTRDPRGFTGQTAYSFQYLDRIGRSTRTLDGQRIFQPR